MKRNKSCIEMHYYLDLPVGKTTMKRNIVCIEMHIWKCYINPLHWNEA